jgi:hypothetical protein
MNETENIAGPVDPALHEAVEACLQAPASDGKERRASQRFAYSAVQEVAACDGAQLPTSEMFRQVQCYDLSRIGMSFIWPHVPKFAQVFIRLAAPYRTICVVARVVRCRPLDASNQRFLVGCEFLDRMAVSG